MDLLSHRGNIIITLSKNSRFINKLYTNNLYKLYKFILKIKYNFYKK